MNPAPPASPRVHPGHILCPLPTGAALPTIRRLAALLGDSPHVLDSSRLLEALLAREAESPTYLHSGLALPHARTASVSSIVIAAGTSPAGIPWGPAPQSARLVLLIGVPQDDVRGYLALLSRISRHAQEPAWIDALLGLPHPAALCAALQKALDA